MTPRPLDSSYTRWLYAYPCRQQVDSRECDAAALLQPPSTRPCNLVPCPDALYVAAAGPWGACQDSSGRSGMAADSGSRCGVVLGNRSRTLTCSSGTGMVTGLADCGNVSLAVTTESCIASSDAPCTCHEDADCTGTNQVRAGCLWDVRGHVVSGLAVAAHVCARRPSGDYSLPACHCVPPGDLKQPVFTPLLPTDTHWLE